MRKKITNFVLNKIHAFRAEWEGSTIRSSRMRRFKKTSRRFGIAIKLVAIWYISIITTSFLADETGAYMTDIEWVNNSIQVGEWPIKWDKSSLKFLENQGSYGVACDDDLIYAHVQNGIDSKRMQGSVKYEVFWIPLGTQGSPKSGSIVSTGIISNLDTGETIKLSFDPRTNPNGANGKYLFKAYQRTGHPGSGELWSEDIVYSGCLNISNVTENEEEKIQDENEVQNNDSTLESDSDSNDSVDKDDLSNDLSINSNINDTEQKSEVQTKEENESLEQMNQDESTNEQDKDVSDGSGG